MTGGRNALPVIFYEINIWVIWLTVGIWQFNIFNIIFITGGRYGLKERTDLMEEREEKLNVNDLRKQRIRERYKGVGEDMLDVIPAAPHEDFYRSEIPKRVAVYARVSTDDPNQTSSYELQKNHYEDLVNRRQNWELVDIYADEGISGTSLQHRDSFIRMIDDCRAGKIEISLPKWIQSHKSETALKPLEIRHFTAFAPSSAALGKGRFSVLCG